MMYSEEQVEWIVAEVIRRLGVAVDREVNHSRATGDEHSSSPVGELKITERVVTLRSIDGRLSGVKRLVVQRGAVVTPAVKDELRKRKIELVVQAA